MTAVDQQSFLIRLGLGNIPASIEEIRHEIGDWLDDSQPSLQHSQAGELVSRNVTNTSDPRIRKTQATPRPVHRHTAKARASFVELLTDALSVPRS